MDVPPINPVAFLWITKVIASRLGTLHVLESLYVYSSRQFESIQKVSRHLRHLWRVYNVIIFEFLYHFVIFTGLATARVLDCVKPLNFLLEYLVGQNFVRQNCKNFVLVSKILSDEKFCPSKILSNISIQKSGKNQTKLSKFRLGVENFVRRNILSVNNFVRRNFVR